MYSKDNLLKMKYDVLLELYEKKEIDLALFI
jgi:hypothetical protein